MTRLDFSILLAGAALALTSAAAHADPLATPAMVGPLAANPSPAAFPAGPLGQVHVTGAVSGLGYVQDHKGIGDVKSRGDISNAQIFVQKTEGLVQFYGQFGAYTIPVVGVPYLKASDTTKATYGLAPQAFVKIAPSDNFNVMVGKLPTLIGAEYTFTFENTNIQRGLLWNQENAVNRGVQVNFARGPLSVSASVNDGFYSNTFSWGSAVVAYAFDANNVLAVAGGANFARATSTATSATPLLQNNQEIVNLIYTHTSGPLTLTPYFQYTHVPAMPALGVMHDASTTGVAVLGKYSFTPEFAVGTRAEYISSSKGGTTNLLYGPGSNAWSLTVTPTYQRGVFFVRGEVSYAKIGDFFPGSGFSVSGNEKSQTRALVESGIIF